MDRDPPRRPWFERCAARAAEADLKSLEAHCEVLIGVALVQADRLERGARLRHARPLARDRGERRRADVQGLANLLFLRRRTAPARGSRIRARPVRRTREEAERWRKPDFAWQASAASRPCTSGSSATTTRSGGAARRGTGRVAPELDRGRCQARLLPAAARERLRRSWLGTRPTRARGARRTVRDARARALANAAGDSRDRLEPATTRDPRRSPRSRRAWPPGRAGRVPAGEDESLSVVVTPRTPGCTACPGKKIEELVERYRLILQRRSCPGCAPDPETDFRRTAARPRAVRDPARRPPPSSRAPTG